MFSKKMRESLFTELIGLLEIMYIIFYFKNPCFYNFVLQSCYISFLIKTMKLVSDCGYVFQNQKNKVFFTECFS